MMRMALLLFSLPLMAVPAGAEAHPLPAHLPCVESTADEADLVPEPSAAALGALGLWLLIIRRQP